MKAIASLIVAAMLVLGMTGCAAKTNGAMKVKCPACGYEFTSPGAESHGP